MSPSRFLPALLAVLLPLTATADPDETKDQQYLPCSVSEDPCTPPRSSGGLPDISPVTASVAEMSPLRRALIGLGYNKKGVRVEVPIDAMTVALDENLPLHEDLRFEGERVFVNWGLFDWDQQTFLTSVQKGKRRVYQWLTNRQRMEKGRSPLCYRAHLSQEEREMTSIKDVLALQRKWCIEFHHLTLNMGGYGLITLVSGLHMGWLAAYGVDISGDALAIIASRMSRKEAELFPRSRAVKVLKNVLHPLVRHENGETCSQVNRKAYNRWRRRFLKWLAARGPTSVENSENVPPAAPVINRSRSRRGLSKGTAPRRARKKLRFGEDDEGRTGGVTELFSLQGFEES